MPTIYIKFSRITAYYTYRKYLKQYYNTRLSRILGIYKKWSANEHTQWNMNVTYEKYILFETRKLYFRKRLLFLRRKVAVNHFKLMYDAYHISTYFTSSVWGILLAVESVGSLCITIEPMKRKITHWGFLSS